MMSISFGLALIGFILLSLSLKRHYQQVWDNAESYSQYLLLNRSGGYLLILLSAIPCVLARGIPIGLVLWLSVLATAAFIQAILLTYWPHRSLLLGGAGMLLLLAGVLS